MVATEIETTCKLDVCGKTRQTDVTLRATGFRCGGSSRVITAETRVGAADFRHDLWLNQDSVLIHARYRTEHRGVLLTRLADTETVNLTAWADDDVPDACTVSLHDLARTKSLIQSVAPERRARVRAVCGEQSYLAVEDDFGALLEASEDYRKFKQAMRRDAGAPCLRTWCIAIYAIPIIGIAGLLIPECW